MRLTELPVDWDDSKLRWLFRVDSGDQISSEKTVDDGYPLVGGNGTRGYVPEWNTRGPLIVVGRVGALCGNVHEYDGRIWASEHALRLFPRSSFCLRYFTYALESAALNQLALGTAQPVIAASRLGEQRLPVPPLATQRAIASFLDHETEKIDTLIETKRRLLDLLEEKRTALITRAVTRGLDPDVPMKDSGVEWLGKIPEHWEVRQTRHLCPPSRPIIYGIVLPGPDVPDGVPLIKGGDVDRGRLEAESLSRTGFEIEKSHTRSRVASGDIVYSIRGSFGEAAIVPSELEGANLTQDAARISPRVKVDARWLAYAITSGPLKASAEAGALGATIKGVNIRDLRRLRIPTPPSGEQAAIADYLDEQNRRMDRVEDRITHAISLLQEYRTSLISHAVTGKIALSATPLGRLVDCDG